MTEGLAACYLLPLLTAHQLPFRRFEDVGAYALYQRAGYQKEDEHSFLWAAAGFDRKALMRKDLTIVLEKQGG